MSLNHAYSQVSQTNINNKPIAEEKLEDDIQLNSESFDLVGKENVYERFSKFVQTLDIP
jgi:hypothetical protein